LSKTVARMVGILVVMTLVAVGCGGASGGGGGGSVSKVDLSGASLTVGSKDFTEQLVLGQITLQALEAAGANVDDQIGLSGTDATRKALISKDIDIYWEYTGTIWIDHLKHTKPIPDSKKQYEAAAKEDLQKNKLKLLEPAPFNNTYALAVRQEAYNKLGVKKLSDLKNLVKDKPDEATVCVESEFNSRDDGLPGMEKAYGFKFPKDNIALFDTGVVYQRTDKGDPCNYGEVFTTDGRIAALKLKVIKDDKNFFPIYNPAPEVRQDTYKQYGKQLDKIFTPIAKKLDTKTMTQMNAAVDVKGQLPDDVAKDWLKKNGFVE